MCESLHAARNAQTSTTIEVIEADCYYLPSAKDPDSKMQCSLCSSKEFIDREGKVRDAPCLRILECRQCGLVTLSSHAHIAPGHYEQTGMHGDELPSIDTWLKDSTLNERRRFESLKPYLVNW
jgi:hypothetical protein